MIAAGAAAHPAAQMCRSHGAQWYVPAHDELELFWINRTAIGLASIGINSGVYYRGSNQVSASYASFQRFSDGSKTGLHTKNTATLYLRCVRREGPPPPPCGGLSLGGYCWYAAIVNQNCDSLCSGKGGCNLTAIRDYTGSGGTSNNCRDVMDGLGMSGTGTGGTVPNDGGCHYSTLFNNRERGTLTTTCSASGSNSLRVCACNN